MMSSGWYLRAVGWNDAKLYWNSKADFNAVSKTAWLALKLYNSQVCYIEELQSMGGGGHFELKCTSKVATHWLLVSYFTCFCVAIPTSYHVHICKKNGYFDQCGW